MNPAKLLLVLLLALCGEFAFAQAAPSVSYGARGGTLTPSTLNNVGQGFRTWASNSSGALGDVIVRDAATVRVGGAANAAMYAQRSLPWASIAGAAAKALPWIAAGAAIYTAFDAVRCHVTNGAGVCDQGKPQTLVQEYSCTGPGGGAAAAAGGASPREACDAAMALWKTANTVSQSNGSSRAQFTFISVNGTTVNYQAQTAFDYTGYPPGEWSTFFPSLGASSTQAYKCVAPPGGSQGSLGADGLCPSGILVAASEADLASKFSEYANKNLAPQFAQDIANNPHVDLDPYAVPMPATGPAKVTGPAETTVEHPVNGPDVVTTKVPEWDITYSPDAWEETPKVVTTHPDGSTTTETGSTDEQKDPCEIDPLRVGCAHLGDPPASQDIPNINAPAGFNPVDFANNAACPANTQFSISIGPANFARSYTLDDMTRLCDFALQVRPIFLALFAASAAIIVYLGLQKVGS